MPRLVFLSKGIVLVIRLRGIRSRPSINEREFMVHLPNWLKTISPLAERWSHYRRDFFVGDLIAGLVVAIMLVPQAMAYALLAGLPAQVGLYASILPLVAYSLFGTSNSLAVGPVAMVSLLVISGVGELAEPGSDHFISLCLTLALLVGAIQILMSVFRLGFLVNFISHPVLIGFTTAAAIVIAFSQLPNLLGISVERGHLPLQTIMSTLRQAVGSNPSTVTIGLAACLLLLGFGKALTPALMRLGVARNISETVSRAGPLVAVVLAAVTVYISGWHEARNVAIVGQIPAGLPRFTMPGLDLVELRQLFPLALVITLVGYLESISVAKALAGRRREKIDSNRELFALGAADVAAAFTGGYCVTGGFSRSLVNFASGARTPLSSLITAAVVALSVAWLTPWFYFIPKAVLAAIVVVAVMGLIDLKTPFQLWKYSRADAVALVLTFAGVLVLGIESGILIGIGVTIAMLMWKMSRPHVAEVGRVGDSEHFRNVLRHEVHQTDRVLAFRVDESLNFANAPFFESYVQEQIAERPEIELVLLISSGINDVDATGIEVLATIREELHAAGLGFFLSDVKGPVMDKLKLAGLDATFLESNVFLSAHEAMIQLEQRGVDAGPRQSTKADRERDGKFDEPVQIADH